MQQDFSHLERKYDSSWEFPALVEFHASCKYFKNSSGLDRKERQRAECVIEKVGEFTHMQ
jgi:hypothetical protein